jgi:hypothetical protein
VLEYLSPQLQFLTTLITKRVLIMQIQLLNLIKVFIESVKDIE